MIMIMNDGESKMIKREMKESETLLMLNNFKIK